MRLSCDIEVKPLTRVEGYGNISIRIRDGRVEEAKWEVVETPRFFEAMLAGRRCGDAPLLCGRICGICSVSHTLASIRAVENACGLVPSRQTSDLRLLLNHFETLQSHILHLYFLAAPDFLGQGSVFPLVKTHPDEVQRALRLKMLANDGCDIIGGRSVHPVRAVVGGFTVLPEKKQLSALRQRLETAAADLDATVELFAGFSVPDFTRETEFVSLKGEGEYPFIGGRLVSSDGVVKEEHEYLDMTNEYTVPHSTSKWTRLSRQSFAVGALARVNNNFAFLHPRARDAASFLGLAPVCHNPFMNNAAQVVECVHVVMDAVAIIDRLLAADPDDAAVRFEPREGVGVAALEAPRGVLYHAYEIDGSGRIRRADCVIPTGQNHANIYHDLAAFAESCAAKGMEDREIEHLAQVLVRAYDPCISCSVH